MRKRVLLAENFVEMLSRAASDPEETLHMGIRALVRTVNVNTGFVVVMDPEDQKKERFGDNCILDCKQAEQDGFVLYVTDGTEDKPKKISIADLQEDDEVFVTLWESEAKKIGKGIPKVVQLQLGTQRMG